MASLKMRVRQDSSWGAIAVCGKNSSLLWLIGTGPSHLLKSIQTLRPAFIYCIGITVTGNYITNWIHIKQEDFWSSDYFDLCKLKLVPEWKYKAIIPINSIKLFCVAWLGQHTKWPFHLSRLFTFVSSWFWEESVMSKLEFLCVLWCVLSSSLALPMESMDNTLNDRKEKYIEQSVTLEEETDNRVNILTQVIYGINGFSTSSCSSSGLITQYIALKQEAMYCSESCP